MELLTKENRFGVYNGIDDLAADTRSFDTKEEAEAALKSFKKRFAKQGFYRSAEGYHVPLSGLDSDGEGGGVFIVSRADDPMEFDSTFWA